MVIERISELPPGFSSLEAESRSEGYRFLEKLRREWESGRNRFDAEGEALFAAFVEGALVGIGGLNRDPYSGEPSVGRVRHLYVQRSFRRAGFGRALVDGITRSATPFRKLRLRTDTAAAAQFYEKLGFVPVAEDSATHELAVGDSC